jgi:hypothetical protein
MVALTGGGTDGNERAVWTASAAVNGHHHDTS